MTEGTSQGLFVVVAIVIFGIFVGLSYTLFGSEGLSTSLENLFTQAFPSNSGFDKDAEYNVAGVVPSEESDFIFDGIDTIIGYKGTDTEVVIPNTIDGLDVTKISGDAFNDKGITKLIMPNSITTIEDGSIVTATALINIEGNADIESNKNTLVKSNNFIMTVSAAEETSTKKVIGAFANNEIAEISFSANIEYIGSFAFFSGNLEDVRLPEGLGAIAEGAFEGNLIEEIEIPSTVETLGATAFKNNSLKEVTYAKGSNVTNIGKDVFSGNNISSITIPKGTSEIPNNAYNNAGLESITIPEGTKTVGDNAFSNNNLTKVTIPDGVTSIGTNAFSYNKLKSVQIPNTVTIIGKDSFRDNLLEEVIIPESVTELDDGSFRDNDLTNVDLPSGLQRIGEYAFYKNKLPIVKLPESLLLIGQHAFEYNELLDVTIPSKLTTIKEWTFAYNKMTKKPTIPTNITLEESYAFYGNLFDEKVIFEDADLANAVASALGVSVSDITKSKMSTLTTLNLSGKSISSLVGLENAFNLKTLDISNNTVTDIKLVTNISTLTELNASNNKIVSLASIGNLNGLNIKNNVLNTQSVNYLESLKGINLNFDKSVVSKVGTTTGTTPTEWLVPYSDYYTIEVSGAKGGTGGTMIDGRFQGSSRVRIGSTGYFGSMVSSKVFLDKGDVIKIYQGNKGATGSEGEYYYHSSSGGGYGGGESKIVSTTKNQTLVSAKGGNGGNGADTSGMLGRAGQTGLGSNMYITGTSTISTATKTSGYVLIKRIL